MSSRYLAELSLQPFLFADAGSSQNAVKKSNTDISTMRIRNGQHQIASYHVWVLSALIRTVKTQLS